MAMKTFSLPPQSKNPFSHAEFWGRQYELRTIYRRLISTPPQCCAIIGETFIGKTRLLRHLIDMSDTTIIDDLGKTHTFTWVYLDCISIDSSELGDYAAAQFWWQLYHEMCERLEVTPSAEQIESIIDTDKSDLITYAQKLKSTVEELLSEQQNPIIFVFDNFEVVARLPGRNSDWLRALVGINSAYVVASRYLLYLLYQYNKDNWNSPSPLQNLFSDPIYLGLMTEAEVDEYMLHAHKLASEFGSYWKREDIDTIKSYCGRHPELIRIGCSHVFTLRSEQSGTTKESELENLFLEESIFNDARTVCNEFWNGLRDPELLDEPRIDGQQQEEHLSRHQKVLLEIAKGGSPTDKKVLFDLARRGLIEQRDGKWRVFAEVMHQFALLKEAVYLQSSQARATAQLNMMSVGAMEKLQISEQKEPVSFSYLEGRAYDYLKARVGEVCIREEIKRAVWPENPPSNTALQKIIERVRDKIEPDVNNPRYLIAIRGLGYMLREAPV